MDELKRLTPGSSYFSKYVCTMVRSGRNSSDSKPPFERSMIPSRPIRASAPPRPMIVPDFALRGSEVTLKGEYPSLVMVQVSERDSSFSCYDLCT